MRKTAPHVLAALGRSVQARQAVGAGRSQAAHVQAAVAAPHGARAPAASPVAQARAAVLGSRSSALAARGVIQRANEEDKARKIREHNISVIGAYSEDIWRQVEKAFFKAGYNIDNLFEAAVDALIGTKWERSKIAHKLGTTTSKKRGGTDEKIRECAEYLIEWAQNH